jgi:hypothetical protein
MSDREMLCRKQEMLRHTIIAQDKTMAEALLLLEQAHTAAHQGNLLACMEYVAQAMEILAND